ncbi:Frigida-like [Dillenia turbinata]|uniref:FRIGIDA-like protein n=1 Tax=Dillenia turbinata TaxID=194707 RepID=A0AAN8VHA5_9MAGN
MATEALPAEVQSFFNKLETRKNLITTCTDFYQTLTNHFTSLQQSLSEKSSSLSSKIESFESKTQETLKTLSDRENSIPEREITESNRVNDLKTEAISLLENEFDQNSGFPEMVKYYCKTMNVSQLIKFLLVKRKDVNTLRGEIVTAMNECVDSVWLIVDAVEDYVLAKEMKVGVADKRWACGVLVQAVFPVEEGRIRVSTSLRERMGNLVEKWKGAMEVGEGGVNGIGASEAIMFLQVVVGFGLKEKFEDEFLRKLILMFPSRREMPKLAVNLVFGDKIGGKLTYYSIWSFINQPLLKCMTEPGDIIDELVKGGKEIDAVYFASESGMTERFQPVALIKSYLKNSRKNANTILNNGKFSSAATEEANALELNSIKAIIKCVEDHKLEADFSLDTLKRRVPQLEKARADRKKSAASSSRPSNKRPHDNRNRGRGRDRGGGRVGGPPPFRPAKAGRFSNVPPSFGQRNLPQPHQPPAGRYSAPYNYPSQSAYEGPGAAYGSGYTGNYAQSPAAPSQQFPPYGSQDVGSAGVRGGGSYSGQQSNYGGYDYNGAAPPAYMPSYPQ